MSLKAQRLADGVDLIELTGDLDFHCATELRSALDPYAERKSAKLLFDLAAVSYLDSSGLAVFVEIFQRFKRCGGKMALCGLSPAVKSIFQISRLDSLFKLAASRDEAAALLAS